MVKGIILSSGRTEVFRPLTYQIPLGLLPVVNRPLLEHQLELLVRNGISCARVSCSHLANKLEEHFGTGSRWGASLSYNYEHPPFGAIPALIQMKPFFQGATLIICEGDVIADVDLEKALEFHYERRADATFLCSLTSNPSPGFTLALDGSGRVRAVRLNSSPADMPHLSDGGICVLEPEILELLQERTGYGLLQSLWSASMKVRLNLHGYRTEEPITRLTTWRTYYKVQRDILEGRFPGVRIPGHEVTPGVWIGTNVRSSATVSFEGPLLVGDNCILGKNVKLGRGTVIGPDVLVDAGAHAERSVILPRTQISKQASVRDAIILGNLLIDFQRNQLIALPGRLTIPQPAHNNTVIRLYHLAHRAAGLLLLLALAPVLILTAAFLITRRRLPLLSRVRRLGVDLRELAEGTLRLRVFDLVFLGPLSRDSGTGLYPFDPPLFLPRSLARLGNLMNVVAGDILLVGNRPMDPELAFAITEEWQRTRFKCQAGLVSVIDTLAGGKLSVDERFVREGYYAIHRSIRGDVVLLMRAIHRLPKRLLRRRRIPRPAHAHR